MLQPDTIFAPATPPGRSGVAILRVSGKECGALWPLFGIDTPQPRLATLVRLKHPENGEAIDHALILFFPSPHSFTGEDVIEFHLHGSRAVMKEMLDLLGRQPGYRLAEPGEFTRRAFEYGKLDLAQVEGLMDLIDAETAVQKRQAIRQMEGRLSEVVEHLRQLLMKGLALLEACLDFPDEDIPVETLSQVDEYLRAALQEMRQWLMTAHHGEAIREGFRVTILGIPNAGKSTLLNALAQRDVAIVSNEAGTTRDVIEAAFDMDGLRLYLTDTAGLRETEQGVEKEGIRRALEHAARADLRVLLLDATLPLSQQAHILEQRKKEDIVVFNKMDLPHSPCVDVEDAIGISAQEKEGISLLMETLSERLRRSSESDAILTRIRHRQAFEKACHELESALKEIRLEIKSAETRLAISSLSVMIGKLDTEALLDIVFKEFCLGK